MNTPNDPMAEIRATFFVECEELLESLQDGLQSLENGETDDETINVVFRAVHSIKGGAGAFGLEDLVEFAHKFESVLDAVRSHELAPDSAVLAVLFQANDMLNDLVFAARNGDDIDKARSARILETLATYIDSEDASDDDVPDFTPMTLTLDFDENSDEDPADPKALPPLAELADTADGMALPESGTSGHDKTQDGSPLNGFVIRFEPQDSLFASGNEPLYLLRLLSEMGEMSTFCDASALPSLKGLRQEKAYLAWEIILETDEDESTLREIFDFVEDVCTLTIKPLEHSDILAMETRQSAKRKSIGKKPSAGEDTQQSSPKAEPPANETDNIPAPEGQPVPAQNNPAVVPADNKPAPNRPKASKTKPTVRVDLGRIDRLVNLVGELVINQAMISQSIQEAGLQANPEIDNGLNEFMQLTREIQDSVMMIRAQPVKSLFQRMARIVRETSADVGKTVQLRTEGETTEVDKTVIEHLADPLTHMIRNAVDHGLETPQDRRAAGKPEEGIITLAAEHRSGRVIIELSDDGAGIDRPRVLQKAIEKGLAPENAELSDTEIDNLLFLPGFSTASEVSNLSGRGVGMDVVRSAIQSLGGRISIHSVPGKGTTFTISLPLTLAVLDGMVVEVAQQTIVVPLSTISETLMLTPDVIRSLGTGASVVQIRERFVPLLDLGAEMGFRAPLESYVGMVVLLISLEDESQMAIIVDMIRDQRQVVIKGLEDTFGRVPGVAAATILGDGKIALILDPVDVVENSGTGDTDIPTNLSLAG